MAQRRDRIPGITPDAERNVNQVAGGLDTRLKALEARKGRAGIVSSDTAAVVGEFLNIEAPAAGLTVILPEPVASLLDARVTLCFRNANPVRIVCIRGKVNRVPFVRNTTVGTYEAICDGLDGWAVDVGVTASGSLAGAQYVLGAAFAGLPNSAVGTDSAEVDFSFTPGALATWALNTASVVFAKLQNLTGLSVLGRAANSAGVMAAITSTASRQVLRNNDGGTSLEWGHPVELLDAGGADTGDVYSLRFSNGTRTTSNVSQVSGAGTVVYNWTGSIVQVNDADYNTNTITLDFDSSTSIIPVFLPAVTTEANIAFQRAALTGFISAAQNVNATQAAGFRVNGTIMPNPRGFVNMLSTTSVLAGGVDDSVNDELELSFQRAALSGAIAALQNSNATLFAGIQNNGAATTDRTNLNFIGFTIADDSVNDRINITAPSSSGPPRFDDEFTDTRTGAFDLTAANIAAGPAPAANVSRLTFTGAAPILNSVEGGTDTGRTYLCYYNGSGTMIVEHSTAGPSGNESRLFNTENDRLYISPRQGFIIQANGTAGWRCVPLGSNKVRSAAQGAALPNTLNLADGSGDLVLSCAASTANARMSAGTSGTVFLQGNTLQASPTGVGGTFKSLKGVTVGSGAGYSVQSGEAHIEASGSSGSILRMRDDLGQNWGVGYSARGANTGSNQSGALTTGGLVICSQSFVANELVAGTTFEFFAHVTITRGGTANATTPSLAFRVNGSIMNSIGGLLQATASNHTAWIRGYFTVLAAPSAASSTSTSMWSAHDIVTAGTIAEGNMLGAATVVNNVTNASGTIDLFLNASATVASVSRVVNHAWIIRKA